MLAYLNLLLLTVLAFGFWSGFESSFVNVKLLGFYSVFTVFSCFVAYIACWRKKLQINFFKQIQLYWLVAIVLSLLLLSVFVSQTPLLSFFGSYQRGIGVFYALILLLLFLVNISNFKKEHFVWFVRGVLCINLLICAYALLQFLGLDPFFSSYDTAFFDGRSFSFLGNPSFLAQFIAMVLPLNLVTFQKYKKFSFISLSLSILALILTMTRSSLLAVICGVFLLAYKKFPKFILRFVLACLSILLVFALIFPRFNLFNSDSLNSVNSRLSIWESSLEYIVKYPFGTGVANFESFYPAVLNSKVALLEDSTHVIVDNPHNQVLSVITATGVVGLMLYLLYVVFVFLTFLKASVWPETALSLSLLVNLLQNQLNFFDVTTLFLTSVLLAWLVLFRFKSQLHIVQLGYRVLLTSLAALVMCVVVLVKMFWANLYYTDFMYLYEVDRDYAISSLSSAVEVTPFYEKFLMDLYEVDASKRLETIDIWQQSNSVSPRFLFYKSQALIATEPEESLDLVAELLDLNPRNYQWWRADADLNYKLGNFQSALSSYTKFMSFFPDLKTDSTKKLKYFYSQSPEFNYVSKRLLELK
jgi:O-antigen ligase